jgi:hypothetical protein
VRNHPRSVLSHARVRVPRVPQNRPAVRYRLTGAGLSPAGSRQLRLTHRKLAFIAVMLAGAGVWASATAWPDIAVAAIIACLGLSSAVRVIRQALLEMRVPGIARGMPAE